MGNTSRAATGRGLTNTGQRVVSRTPVRARSVAPAPRVRTYSPRRPGERERALRHIASSAHGKRSKNPNILQLLKKIRNSIQKLRAARNQKKSP